MFSRRATDSPCALQPLGLGQTVTAAGPMVASALASQPSRVVRFMKSSTPSPDEKRAPREVGSTWLGPPT